MIAIIAQKVDDLAQNEVRAKNSQQWEGLRPMTIPGERHRSKLSTIM